MKKLLLLTFVCLNVSALEVKDVVGKYIITKCNYISDVQRAYIKVETLKTGATQLNIQLYGSDAVGIDFLLGSGSRQAPGTSVSSHGVVTQSWVTQWGADSAVSTETTIRASMNYKAVAIKTLKKVNNFLVYTEVETSNSSPRPVSSHLCEMYKAN